MKKYLNGFVLILMMGFANIAYSQAIYKIQDSKGVDMKISGTSTLHDWEMDGHKATGEAQFIFEPSTKNVLTSLKSLFFTLKVKDLKSDSKGLDKNAYKALKSDDYPAINYQLSSTTISPQKGGYLLKTKGKLTIAGCIKDIFMDIHAVVHENGTVTCKGLYNLKMTDYKVEPPSFMMGMMNTGDDITLSFEVMYQKTIEN